MGRKSNIGIPGLSFNLNRALGITPAKRKIVKFTGISITKAGRKRKLGAMILKMFALM